MPKVTFSQRDLNFSKRVMTKKLVTLTESLRPMVADIVKEAFLNYATKHGCGDKQLKLEWDRFNKELQKVL